MFDLEAFKAGQNAVISYYGCRNVEAVLSYRFTSKNGKEIVCEGVSGAERVFSFSEEELYANAKMVSRHDELKKTYVEVDVWQYRLSQDSKWFTQDGEPKWHEFSYYRLHPLNDFIKAYNAGETVMYGESMIKNWGVSNWDNEYLEENLFSVITKPKTKTVYEWMWLDPDGYWHIAEVLYTESEVKKMFSNYKVMKTGRSWEVEA